MLSNHKIINRVDRSFIEALTQLELKSATNEKGYELAWLSKSMTAAHINRKAKMHIINSANQNPIKKDGNNKPTTIPINPTISYCICPYFEN